MAGGPTITVRQIASYPAAVISPNDLVLVQQAGQGGPYAAPSAFALISEALMQAGPLGIGVGLGGVPGDAAPTQVFVGNHVMQPGGAILFNAYFDTTAYKSWGGGSGGLFTGGQFGFEWAQGTAAPPGQSVTFTPSMTLNAAGALSLPHGTLTVARDPASALEVATMGWVGNSTVASFNGRRGVVTLEACDISLALGVPVECLATIPQVNELVCAAIQDLIRTYPAVWSWNGRVGDVWLSVADMNFAAAANPPECPPLTIPTPPETVTDGEVVTAAWVIAYLTQSAGFATQDWVIAYVAQNAVTAFNGRRGLVTLTLADIQGAGGAPAASPVFSGVPTAPTAAPGSATSQLATTAFVQAAITNATAGVSTFNGRSGAVVLNSTDLTSAGGALLASPAFTGTPTAPTPAAGNSSTLLATTAFVANAIAGLGAVTSFNTRTGAVTLLLSDVTGVGGAPIASPALTGTPTAPTAAAGTSNQQLATTAFVTSAISSIGIGVTSFEGRTGAVTLQANDISAAGGLINPSVALTGVPTAPTAPPGTSSTQIASTAFVAAAIIAGSVTAFNGRSGAVTLAGSDISGAGGALLASPAFTGTPTAPTAAPGTSSTQLATTAFVTGALATQAANSVTSFNGRSGIVTLTTGDITGAGGAPIASPTFTGTPSVPTATAGTSTTQAASTAFVMNAIAASTAGVTSFNSRTGAVTLQANDVSAVGGALLASPTFTGTPTAPTPTAGDNSTNIATTAFVAHALATAAVQSFNGRTGAVTLTAADVNAAGGPYATVAQLAGYLPLTAGSTAPLSGTLYGPSYTMPWTAGGATNWLGFNGINPSGSAWQTINTGPVATMQLSGANPPTLNFAISNTNTQTGGSTPTLAAICQMGPTLTSFSSALTSGGTFTANGAVNIAGNCNITNTGFSYGVSNGAFLWVGQSATVMSIGSAAGHNMVIQTAANPVFIWNGAGAGQLMSLTSGGVLTVTSVTQTSDATTKNTIEAYAPGVSIAAQLAPKTFIFNNDPDNQQHLGFIAQDVQPILPDAVSTSEMGTGTVLGLDVTAIVAVLANAVKQLLARIEALESNASITPSAAQTA